MSRNSSYNGKLTIGSGLIPANKQDFPLMDAHDVLAGSDDLRLDARLDAMDDVLYHTPENSTKPIALDSRVTTLENKVNQWSPDGSVKIDQDFTRDQIGVDDNNNAVFEDFTTSVPSTKATADYVAHFAGATHDQDNSSSIVYADKGTYCEFGNNSNVNFATFNGKVTLHSAVQKSGAAFPKPVTSVAASSFSNNNTLTHVSILDGIVQIDVLAFTGCSKLKSVTLPSSLLKIGSQAFFGCSSLEEVVLPDSLWRVDKQAFYNAPLKGTLTIPASCQIIGSKVFTSSGIDAIIFESTPSSLDKDAFLGCTCDIYVPWAEGDVAEPENSAWGSTGKVYYNTDTSPDRAARAWAPKSYLHDITVRFGDKTPTLELPNQPGWYAVSLRSGSTRRYAFGVFHWEASDSVAYEFTSASLSTSSLYVLTLTDGWQSSVNGGPVREVTVSLKQVSLPSMGSSTVDSPQYQLILTPLSQ